MKILLAIFMALFATSISAREVELSGLSAKAVYDAMTSTEKLNLFQDSAMGKTYVTTGVIKCFKSMVVNEEEMACSFSSDEPNPSVNVVLSSKQDYEVVGEIRMVLAQATGAEVQVNDERKELALKSLSCKRSGYNHVLDDLEIEIKYSCSLTL